MLKKLEEIAGWLFEKAPEGWFGQLAFGRADKTATLWLPGKKTPETAERLIRTAAIGGCTQRAYLDPMLPMQGQPCWVCWVGLDIDDTSPEQTALVRQKLGSLWSIRTSHSGNGLHAIARLDKPVFCQTSQSQSVVKRITAWTVATLEGAGVQVCKADCRVFWLVGGKQQWLHKTDEFLSLAEQPTLPPAASSVPAEQVVNTVECLPGIRLWCERFAAAGVLRSIHRHQTCYLDDALKCLEKHGEFARKTKSGRRGNKQPNAYIDISEDSIQLWSYADGCVLWSYEDPDLGGESEDEW